MKQEISLIKINKLKTHENVSLNKVSKIIKDIYSRKTIINPVVADKKTKVILDGHHRVAALIKLGARYVPTHLVNYDDENVRVYLRRKNLLMKIIKEQVISVGTSKNNFPTKTTRHLIKNRKRNINIQLAKLF